MSGPVKSSLEAKAHREFVAEAEEILELLRSDLADLLDQQAHLDDDTEVDPDLLNRRSVKTVCK